MISFDTSQLPARIASLLMMPGTDGPPLDWSKSTNACAKSTLDDAAEDSKLFTAKEIANPTMASAVRALLYLWNGCLADAANALSTAPPREASYINGLRERHAGRLDPSKVFFQKTKEHRIFKPLATFTLGTINLGSDKNLDRFRGMVELAGLWEPFGFTDLYAQARAGQLSSPHERTVRILQCREYDLLFRHCYEAATGERMAGSSASGSGGGKWRSNKGAAPESNQKKMASRPAGAKAKGESPVVVRCPKCEESAVLPPSLRGQKHKCRKCSSIFLVPGKPPLTAANRSSR